jgi:gluconolactonase
LHLPEAAANLTFGGPQRNRLFVTATTSLYSIRLNVTGAPLPSTRSS